MATSGVNVKVGVSGISTFKQGIKDAQASVKALDQQMKLQEQQFRQTGDAETYMQQKTEALHKQIEQQNTIVKKAEEALKSMKDGGVNQTSAAFQQMQQHLYKAQTDLSKMETDLQNVATAGEEAGDGVDAMNAQLKRIGDQVDFSAIKQGLNDITSLMESAAQKAWNLGAALVNEVLGAGTWADNLVTDATVWEISPEQLYRMQKTANVIDTTVDDIMTSRKKLITAMGKTGNQETMGAFAALGISDLSGTDENIEDVFWKAGEALLNWDNKVERNAYSMLIFGKNFEELIPLFSAGRDEYEKTMAAWTWIGDDQLESLTKMDDQYQKLQSEWEAMKLELESALAPALEKVMGILTELLKEFNTYMQSEEGQEMLEALGQAVEGLFEDLANIDVKQVMEDFKDVFTQITNGLKWIFENRDGILRALQDVFGIWATMKVSSGVVTILQLINGLRNLTGGGGGGDVAIGVGTGLGGRVAKALGGTAVGKWLAGFASTLTMFDPSGITSLIPSFLMDHTAFGKELRDGGTLGSAFARSWSSIKDTAGYVKDQYVDYFTKQLPQGGDYFWRIFGYDSAEDAARRFTANVKATEGWVFDDNLTAEEAMAMARTGINNPDVAMSGNALERMIAVAGNLDSTTRQVYANSLTSADVANFNGLPAAIAQAVENANIRVYIDGALAGEQLAPHVGRVMAGVVAGITRP